MMVFILKLKGFMQFSMVDKMKLIINALNYFVTVSLKPV